MNEQEFKDFVAGLKSHDLNYSNTSVISGAFGIASEVGELLDIVKKEIEHHKTIDVEHLKEELGDLLHYMVCIMNVYNFTFNDLMESNVEKLRRRYPNGYSNEDALLRRDKQGE